MKSVVLAFIAVFAAVVSQGASILWSSGKIQVPEGTTTPIEDGVLAYYIVVDKSAYEVAKGQSIDAIYRNYYNMTDGFATDDQGNLSSWSKGGVAASYGGSPNGAAGTITTEDSTQYVIAIFEYYDAATDSYYATARAVQATASDSGVVTPGGENQNVWMGFSSSSWVSVPEPATIALLSLGLVAIGLKRKVA